MKLSIVIVNWNTGELLKKCVTSVFKYLKNVEFEVFVVDNNSKDKSLKNIKQVKEPALKIIQNKENLGFAKANNQAIRQAKGEYVLLLNPDTEFIDDSCKNILKYLDKNKKVGIAGCKLLFSNKKTQSSVRGFPSLSSQVLILLKLHHFRPNLKTLKDYYRVGFDYEKQQEVDQVMGAFFVIRKKLIEEIGCLDEKFYIWFEEVDYCLRAKKKGWKVVYFPQTQIVHHSGESFSKAKVIKKQLIFNRSLRYFFRKHHSFASYLVLLLMQIPSIFLASLVAVFKRRKK